MALPADFSKIFGSTATGGLTPIGDVNYAKGWEFVGSNPPTKNDFSYLQNLSDQKSQWLYSNKLQRANPFGDIKSDGAAAVKTALENLGLGEAAKRNVGTGTNQLPDMSAYSGAYNSTGWRKTPDGYIEQWGTVVPTAANVQQQFSFPIPFTNSCVSLQLTSFNNSTTIVSAQGFIIDKTKFSALVSAANNAIYFRALGK